MDCVKDLRSPNQMGALVSEGINYALEQRVEFRVVIGKLFNKLVQEKILAQDKFLEGYGIQLAVPVHYNHCVCPVQVE